MTTPLIALMTQIADDWEALTPPDRTSVVYHESDARAMLTGSAGDRGFVFGLATRVVPSGEFGAALTQVTWTFDIMVRFSGSGRSMSARSDAVAREINLLCRSIETRASWPAGVLAVITRDAVPDSADGELGDVIYTLGISALCEETD